MDYTTWNILQVLAILALAAAVQGAAGFGFGLVAVALLGAVVDIKAALIVPVLGALSVNATIFVRLRRHFRWRRLTPLVLALLAGVPFGVLFLVRADPAPVRLALGVLLLGSVGYRLVPHLARRPWHPVWLGVPCGLLSGALSGAFGTGGPPVVAYTASQGLSRFRYAVTVQVLLAIGTVVRVGCLGVSGALTPELLALSAGGVAAAIAGVHLGLGVLQRLSDRGLNVLVTAALAILGLLYILRP